jgi:branched-chain amino acid transport system permease protein
LRPDKTTTKPLERENDYVSLKTLKKWVLIATSLFILFLLVLPRLGNQYLSYLMLSFFGYAIAVLGFNLLFGYAGLLSFGHAFHFAVGAYTVAFFIYNLYNISMEIILLIAIGVSAILAALIGAICVRYTKVHFGILTLAFNMLFYSFLLKFYYLTGGDEGMHVLRPILLGFDLSALPKMRFLLGGYYYYALVVLVIAALAMWKIISSPFGLSLMAIRDNSEKATSLGINAKRFRWYAFIISGIYTAVGGVLIAPVVGQVDPTLAYWTHSGTIVFMTLLGGFTIFLGPVLGALIYIFLQDTVMSLLYYWRFCFGAILVFIVIVAPGGIAGVISSLVKKEKSGE